MSTEQLLKNAWEVVNALNALACKGDGEAAVALRNIGARCASETQSLLPCSPDLQAKLKASAYWPVVLPVKKTKRDQLISELLNLDLAKDCELNEAGKARGAVTRAVQRVWELIRHLRTMKKTPPTPLVFIAGLWTTAAQREQWKEWAIANAKKIPQRPTKQNAPDLAKLTKPLLSIFWGEDFENHRDFADDAKNARHQKKTPAQLRDVIRKLWAKGWESITWRERNPAE